MATLTGAASFKKKAGMLRIFEDETPPRLQWKAIDSNVEIKEMAISLDQITNLQATPATSTKLALNVITDEGKKNVFSFNSRETMDNVKGLLQQLMARKRQELQDSAQSTPAPQVQVVNDEFLLNLLDAKKLLKNHQLQQRLLKENKNLMNTFREAVMNNGLDPQEFWNTRIHMLRSYAIQHSQKRGSYNVLSTIKPVATSDNEVNVSVTREKIHSIFEQYPIVRKIYNDNVPKKFGESVFWSRFFSSKLFRKLRGEKNYNNAKVDSIFDKYLHVDPDYEGEDDPTGTTTTGVQQQQQQQQVAPQEEGQKHGQESVPHHHVNKLIDLTGNELDVSERMGNSPDFTMKFDNDRDMISILKSMNRLSKKMVSNALDNSKQKEGEDDLQAQEELELSDLEEKEVPEYNELSIKNHPNVTTDLTVNKLNREEFVDFVEHAKFNNEKVSLSDIVSSVEQKSAILEASKEVSSLIRTNAKQSKQSWQLHLYSNESDLAGLQQQHQQQQAQQQQQDGVDTGTVAPAQTTALAEEEEETNLTSEALENLRLCHSTSIEFLRHFWLNLQDLNSNEKTFKNILKGLKKSMSRIDTIIDAITSEEEKNSSIQVMAPLKKSLQFAVGYYEDLSNESKATVNDGELKHKSDK